MTSVSGGNLTRSLGVNIYQFYYCGNAAEVDHCLADLDLKYSCQNLEEICRALADGIRARVLNVSTEAYKPQGASVAVLVSEERESLLAHLDTSHITVHTYTDRHPAGELCGIRLDFDISSCGAISPLGTLPLLLTEIPAHQATLDYRIRGHARDGAGLLQAREWEEDAIPASLSSKVLRGYRSRHYEYPEHRMCHSRLILKEIDARTHVRGGAAGEEAKSGELARGLQMVKSELETLFDGDGSISR